jgi:hypothetical protein
MLKRAAKLVLLAAFVAFGVAAPERAAPAGPSSLIYVVRYDHWSQDDERDYRAFIQAIGESSCNTLDACLHGPANPFRDSDLPNHRFVSDCSHLPYVLRFYYAWKRGLPFSYVAQVAPVRPDDRGDLRYTHEGNRVVRRVDVPGGVMTGYAIIDQILATVNSATYRIHPERDSPPPDFYSPSIDPQSIRAGTVIYDPAGHLAIVFRVDPDGRIHFFDAHTDYSLTQMFYDLRFAREKPAVGAGFKNWRPLWLVGAKRRPDGTLSGGHIALAPNKDIPDFSLVQYYGNGPRPPDAGWDKGTFTLNGETMDYYDYVRAAMAGGQLMFDPLKEVREMANSICYDLHYRAQAVDLALAAGMARRPEPERLPENIYGTYGDWEMYSTPSRDARLKTAFKALRDIAERFVRMQKDNDGIRHLYYFGDDIAGDMLTVYDASTANCSVTYTKSDGSPLTLRYEEARRRLFAMSFDPYQCAERRWGASDPAELASCKDGPLKQAWYFAEQNLRNQLDRTYDARMDYTLDALKTPGPGKGVPFPPDTDVRAYLLGVIAKEKQASAN